MKPSERVEQIYRENGEWRYIKNQGNVFHGNRLQAILQYLDEQAELKKKKK